MVSMLSVVSLCISTHEVPWGKAKLSYHGKWFEQEKGLWLTAQVPKEAGNSAGASMMLVTGIRTE